MRIAFDAKRAYQNHTGLGHYSRTLIASLATDFPGNEYYLMAPKLTPKFDATTFNNVHAVTPAGMHKLLPSLWRSNWVKQDLKRLNIDLYHGLSHEIPVGIQHTCIKSVVTIHDLIFERYPRQYKPLDVVIYRKKFTYACAHADKVIAISQQTKQDLIDLYKVDEGKIEVCYQSCDAQYSKQVSNAEKAIVKDKYSLPENYFLYVGSVIERKNLLTICKAVKQLQGVLDIPLVVIGGDTGDYEQTVKQYLQEAGIVQQVYFLSQTEAANGADFRTSKDFPAIYQQALALIYPSVYEGFGLPVLEALCSGTPVITSNISCMPETGGDAAFYVNPKSVDEMATAMQEIAGNEALRASMIAKGYLHAQKFTPEACAAKVMQVYQRLF